MTVAATLPLAFVMIAGPQIISSFFFATSEKWKSVSATYVLGAAVSLLAVVTAAYLGGMGITSGGSDGGDSKSDTLDYVIVGLLLVAMAYVFHGRKRTEPPKWMGKLETASARFGFTLGFLLLGFFPSDLLCSIVIGTHLANHGDPWWHALPFVFLGERARYGLFPLHKRKGEQPGKDWMIHRMDPAEDPDREPMPPKVVSCTP